MWTLLFFTALFAAIKAADYSRNGRQAFILWDAVPVCILAGWAITIFSRGT